MHGLRAYNDNGILQIDSKYKNMELVGSGSAVASAGGIARYVDVNVVGVNPLLAFRHAYGVTCVPIAKSGSTFTFRLYTYYAGGTTGDLNINYWIFDSIASPSASSYGLQVFNESGEICYDSAGKYFKVLEADLIGGAPVTYTGKSILVAPCIFGYSVSWAPSPNLLNYCRNENYNWVKTTGVNTAEVFSQIVAFNCAFSSAGQVSSNRGIFAVLDVTGYGI